MFSLPLLRGDPKTALARPYTMVLTEPLARRLFGESDPIGQVVHVEKLDYEVTGIVGQLPANSLLQVSALSSLSSAANPVLVTGWNASGFRTFVQLTPGADPAVVAARISDIVKEAGGRSKETDSYALQPLKSIYFDTEVPSAIGPEGNPVYLALCAILAVVILTIAGVNYVNLATARAGRRIHEIGVRKALGAHRSQLMRQLLSESVLLSAAATVLGVAMAEVMVLLLPALVGFDFEWSSLRWTSSIYAGAAALAVGVGLVAGAYPAWVVARFQPTAAVHGGRVGGVLLRRGLVVTQFTATTALLTMTLLIWHQIDYIQDRLRENSILGAEPEQVVVVENRGLTIDQARAFKTELLQNSRIAAVSLSFSVPGGVYEMRTSTGEEQIEITVYQADSDFVKIMGLRMSQGRALTDEPADADAVVINETAARILGLTEPLGETISVQGGKRVVGVIEDFHFHGPRYEIEPLIIEQVALWASVTYRAGATRASRRSPQSDRRPVGHHLTLPPHSAQFPRRGRRQTLLRGPDSGPRTHGLSLFGHRRRLGGTLRHGRTRRPRAHQGDRHPQGVRRFSQRPHRYDDARLCQTCCHRLPAQRADRLWVGHSLATGVCLSRGNRRGPVPGVGRFVLRHRRADGGAPSDAGGADQSDRDAAH